MTTSSIIETYSVLTEPSEINIPFCRFLSKTSMFGAGRSTQGTEREDFVGILGESHQEIWRTRDKGHARSTGKVESTRSNHLPTAASTTKTQVLQTAKAFSSTFSPNLQICLHVQQLGRSMWDQVRLDPTSNLATSTRSPTKCLSSKSQYLFVGR